MKLINGFKGYPDFIRFVINKNVITVIYSLGNFNFKITYSEIPLVNHKILRRQARTLIGGLRNLRIKFRIITPV